MMWTADEIGWPWLCLGGGLALFAVMFFTDLTRSHPARTSRWLDPVWLAWFIVPVLMVHMFEEYGHDIFGRVYEFTARFCPTLGLPPYPGCPVPRVHYPLLNMGVAWIGAPIAALFARRNLVVGLTFSGLILVNGLSHVAGVLVAGSASAAGVATGTLFLPLVAWMVYATRRAGALSWGGILASVAGGVVAHIALFGAIGLVRVGGPTALILGDLVVIALPFLVAGVASRFIAHRGQTPHRT